MAKSPNRNRTVYFLGAGFSKAFGLPNTAELLNEVHALSDGNQHWGVSRDIGGRLEAAYNYFYPEEGKNFRPPVGDFFTVLSTYRDIGSGLPQAFADSSLLDDLKFAIASILCSRIKAVDEQLNAAHESLENIIRPGNIIITSNWDYLVERACIRRGVPFRLRWYHEDSAVTILKLHGAIDWTARADRKHVWNTNNYLRLKDLIKNSRSRHDTLDGKEIGRCQAIEYWTRGYQKIKGATQRPFMLTMARGKTEHIQPLHQIWSDAYHVFCRARECYIVGYSMPDDDVEIRTLLRAGVCRGNRDPKIYVINPAPDVHVRIRQQIHTKLNSDYSAVQGLA